MSYSKSEIKIITTTHKVTFGIGDIASYVRACLENVPNNARLIDMGSYSETIVFINEAVLMFQEERREATND